MQGFQRFVRRGVVGVLIFTGVLAILFFGTSAIFKRQGNRELNEITARLDEKDPGWRLEPLLANRDSRPVAQDTNATPFVFQALDACEPEWEKLRYLVEWGDGDPRSNHTPRFEHLVWLAAARSSTEKGRGVAREELLTRSSGRYAIAMKENPFATLLPHLDKVRQVAFLLEYDAMLAALDNEPTRGLRSARSSVNVGRSIGDEPFLVSQLVRMACNNVASRSAARLLAWSEVTGPNADAELAALQAAFAAEAETPWFEYGMRGERASINSFFEGLESGKIKPEELEAVMGCGTPQFFRSGLFDLYRGFLPGDHAETLRILTHYLEISKLPYPEQRVELNSVKFPPKPPESLGYVITHLIVPACGKIGEAGLRCRAELLSASVGIACERFRIRHGRWPDSLEEIPRDILPVIPLDPYDGAPIRYHRMPDGAAVFSIGPDGLNPPMDPDRPRTGPFNGLGLGWRMYDPQLRGLPPDYRRPPIDSEAAIDP